MSKADEMKNQPAKKKALYAEIDEDLLKEFKKVCVSNDISYKEVTEKLVAGYLSGKYKIDWKSLFSQTILKAIRPRNLGT